MRYGIPRLPQAGRERLTVGPLGYDRFLAPGDPTYFRLELPEARPAQLQVGQADPDQPFHNAGSVGEITKKSLPPVAEVELDKTPDHDRIVTVTAESGQPYVLQQFEDSREYRFERSGNYWVSTVHSGHATDSVDATAIVARWTRSGLDRGAFLDSVVEIDGKRGWTRRCNLLDPMTVFFKVGATGRYEVLSRGVRASFRIEPFFTFRPHGYETPPAKPNGSTWDLDAGFYVLTVLPDTKGILDIVVRPYGVLTYALELLGKEPEKEQTPLRAGALFPSVTLDTDDYYVAYLNEQPGVRSGVVLRALPLDLTEALPVAQRPGDEVKAPFKAAERGTLRARDEAGNLIGISVDGGAPVKEATVEPGDHTFSVAIAGKETVLYSVALEPQRLQAAAPLPPVPAEALDALPKFPTLTAAAPIFLDMENAESATFLVRADTPALYRLESTGLLATEGNVRTRTVLSLDRQGRNGVGRNFLIQQYLREGDYQLTVQPRGESAGHLGVRLGKAPVTDGGLLAPSVPARISLPAGQGVAYRFTIPSHGEYHLRTLGLGHEFRCRLEDADGWPIESPNIRADITRTFEPGDYRLVLLPEDVMTRRVTVLERIAEPLHFVGHGPHQLPLDRQVEHVWVQASVGGQEPPDVWEFSMPAAAGAQIDLSAEMTGVLELVRRRWRRQGGRPRPGEGLVRRAQGGGVSPLGGVRPRQQSGRLPGRGQARAAGRGSHPGDHRARFDRARGGARRPRRAHVVRERRRARRPDRPQGPDARRQRRPTRRLELPHRHAPRPWELHAARAPRGDGTGHVRGVDADARGGRGAAADPSRPTRDRDRAGRPRGASPPARGRGAARRQRALRGERRMRVGRTGCRRLAARCDARRARPAPRGAARGPGPPRRLTGVARADLVGGPAWTPGARGGRGCRPGGGQRGRPRLGDRPRTGGGQRPARRRGPGSRRAPRNVHLVRGRGARGRAGGQRRCTQRRGARRGARLVALAGWRPRGRRPGDRPGFPHDRGGRRNRRPPRSAGRTDRL